MKKILLLLIALGLAACSTTREDKENMKELEEDIPLQEAFNVTYLYSDSAVIQARLEASHVIEKKIDEELVSFFDEGLTLYFYNPTGQIESQLTAYEGTMDMKSGVASARGDVVITNYENERLTSEELFWDKERDMIWTHEFVTIRTKEQIIYGDSLEANADFSEYRIFSIRGIVNLNTDE
ncbi:MAG: LPS export ABC transporter periplasmic protein LptC [Bacteroidia bacterium]|nr:LPS export ABC transporter periplasmic protein LptC [Bacteroidia bacterium]